MTAAVELSFHADAADPFVDYAMELVERVTGVRLRPAREPRGEVDVYYGDDAGQPCRLRIPRVARYTAATVPRLPDDSTRGADTSREFPFDLFSAVRFWLADEGHADAPDDAFDEHDRLRAGRSVQELVGLREVPVVNAYLVHFRRWLAARTGVDLGSHLPAGKRCVVVLSHDVDSPIDPTTSRHALALGLANVRRARKPLHSTAYAVGAAIAGLRCRVVDPSARHRLFDEIMEAEEQRGFRSTFFFAAVSRFDREGTRRDVGYDVRRPPLPSSIRSVADRGFGLGLHVGYRALADVHRMSAERERLEAVAGVPVLGTRHHYWHMTRPVWASLAAHAAAGFCFDSSVAFNAAPGYRLGVALPFYPWNPETASAVPVLQIPVLVMDSMLMVPQAASPEAPLDRFAWLLAGLKRYEGAAAIDWHEYTSYPGSDRYRSWGDTYLGVLDHLAADPDVLVQTYAELVTTLPRHSLIGGAEPESDRG